jgi:hypothetical protein
MKPLMIIYTAFVLLFFVNPFTVTSLYSKDKTDHQPRQIKHSIDFFPLAPLVNIYGIHYIYQFSNNNHHHHC